MYKTIEELLNGNFRKDFIEMNPDDYQIDKVRNVTYKEILETLANGKDIYETIGDVDSVIRESLFANLEEYINHIDKDIKFDYDDLYYTWLGKKTENFKKFEEKYLK